MIRSVRSVWNAVRLLRSVRADLCILTYHGVVDRKADAKIYRNLTTVDGFREQVRLLRRLPVLSLSEAEQRLDGEGARQSRAVFAITLDDGLHCAIPAA